MFLSSSTENENTYETKKTKPKSQNYFDVREEEAVVHYIEAETQKEKEEIYNEFLKYPLDKMIDSIIRRYKLYRKNYSFDELHADTLSYLILKAEKFNSDTGKRAYSYYGTICKHYIIGLIPSHPIK